jgi:hypothetical protein
VLVEIGSNGVCSGALVSQSWVLTAAHCVRQGGTGAILPADDFSLLIGKSSPADKEGATASVDRVVALQDYRQANNYLVNDLALLHIGPQAPLPSNSAPLPLAFSLSAVPAGTDVQWFGYGWNQITHNAGSLLQATRPGDWVVQSNCGGAGDVCLDPVHGATSYPAEGDSGSPIVALLRGGYVDDAAFTGPGGLSGPQYGSSVAAHLSWIRQTAGLPVVAANTIVRDPSTAASYLVESDGFRHWIPTGGDYLCFTAKGTPVQNMAAFALESIPQDFTANATCTPPGTSPNPSPPNPSSGSVPSIQISWSSAHPSWISMTLNGFSPGWYTYTCNFASGGDASFNLYEATAPETFDNAATCYDTEVGDHVWVTIGSVTSNTLTVAGASPPPPPPPAITYPETTGSVVHTWTDYLDAGGTAGSTIPTDTTVQISCKVQGFQVQDGDTWWYRIAQSPWDNGYYASADAFFNDGQTSGSLSGTPFVDPNVPDC